ncbi:MAG: cytoplasmic protein [Magnetovibrio sp.]|nr:cytoplasmic protein [Magnetovibrio sp.]|tara:strand:+ start:652 stop:1338 length:687 start_codon:yes stop_codon:yes gene_type:complete
MPHPLMPKATAVWLIDKTTLTFEQIALFCGLHELEVQAIADGEVALGMHGLNPVSRGELSQEELDRCQQDPNTRLALLKSDKPQPKSRNKGARYTPVSKRGDRPNAIAWLLKNYPELADSHISKLIGTTKPTINAIRSRTHWNTANITPLNPVGLGLCNGEDLEDAIAKARKRAGKLNATRAATAPDGIVGKHRIQEERTAEKFQLKTSSPNLESNEQVRSDTSELDP